MQAEQCAEKMRKDAQSHGWLGVSLDLSADGQMRISRVWPGSPAERSGFRLDDRVISMNGVEVGERQLEKLFSLMRDARIGDKMTFTVARGSENLSLHATLAKIPDDVLAENIEKHMQESPKIAKK
jgi:S1-C subfamily serine protease